jgi:hypothetical protein
MKIANMLLEMLPVENKINAAQMLEGIVVPNAF